MNEWFKYGFLPVPVRKELGHPDNLKRYTILTKNIKFSEKLIHEEKPHPTLKELFEMEE